MLFFLFKQKTAYEMRSSDWSSDVCSSDLMLMIVIDPKGFGAGIPFRDEIDQLVEHVSSSKTAVGFDRIRFPGDPEREAAAERRANGIQIDDNTWDEMRRAGLDVGLSEADFAA